MRQEFHGLKNAMLLTLATSFLFLSCNSSNTTTQPEFKIYSAYAPDFVVTGKTFPLKTSYSFGTGQPSTIKVEWKSEPEITITNSSTDPLVAATFIPDNFAAPSVKITANVKSGEKTFSYTKEIKVVSQNTVSIDIKPTSTDLNLVSEAASSDLRSLPLTNGLIAWGRGYTPENKQVFKVIRYGADLKLVNSFGTSGIINAAATQYSLTNYSLKALTDAQENLYLFDLDPFSSKTLKFLKFDANGQPVTSFGSAGLVEIPFSDPVGQLSSIRNSVFLGLDNRIYIINNKNLSRYSSISGSNDPAFGNSGQYSLPKEFTANVLSTDSQGRVIVAGDFFKNGFALRTPMAIRLTSDGKLDTTFANKGTLEVVAPGINVRDSFGTFNSVLLSANDGILFSGLSGINFGGANIGALLAQFKPDGTSDLSFGVNGLSFLYAKQYNEFSTLNLQRLNSSIYLFSPAEIIEFNASGIAAKYSSISYVGNPTEGPRDVGTAVKIASDKSLSVFGILCSQFSSCGSQYAFATVRF
jgi:hypothetical protein